jgi:hypothetical protein
MRHFLCSLLLLTACTREVTAPTFAATLATDPTAYSATLANTGDDFPEYHVVVIARYMNRGSTPIYWQPCEPTFSSAPDFTVDLVDPDSGASSAYNGAALCVGAGPVELRPGESRMDTLHVSGPSNWNFATDQYSGTLQGRMQLHYAVYCLPAVAGDVCDVPESARTSNEFTVAVAP